MRKASPKLLGDILKRTLERAGIASRVKGGVAFQRWAEAVGEIAARKSQPYRLGHGRLSVRVESSPWLQELKMRVPEILDRLNAGLAPPPVREIYFRLGEIPVGAVAEERPAPGRRKGRIAPFVPTPEQEERIERDLAPVGDPEVREALRRMRLAHEGAVRWRAEQKPK